MARVHYLEVELGHHLLVLGLFSEDAQGLAL